MRFDLLDEYSTIVPFGFGTSRNGAFQDPAVLARAAECGTIANSRLELLHKLSGSLRQAVLSGYRNLVEKGSCLF